MFRYDDCVGNCTKFVLLRVVYTIPAFEKKVNEPYEGLSIPVLYIVCSFLPKRALEVKGNPVANVLDLPNSNQDPAMETHLGRLEAQIEGLGAIPCNDNIFESDVSLRMEKHLDLMDIKVGKMLAKGDDDTMKFSGLGFTKRSNASSICILRINQSRKQLNNKLPGLLVCEFEWFDEQSRPYKSVGCKSLKGDDST
jgi:hypothetical protein